MGWEYAVFFLNFVSFIFKRNFGYSTGHFCQAYILATIIKQHLILLCKICLACDRVKSIFNLRSERAKHTMWTTQQHYLKLWENNIPQFASSDPSLQSSS